METVVLKRKSARQQLKAKKEIIKFSNTGKYMEKYSNMHYCNFGG